MTVEKQDIRSDFYAGNTKDIQITIVDDTSAPFNLSGCEIAWCLFTDDWEPLVRKSSANGSAEIEVTDEAGGIVEIHLIPTDTATLQGTYRHQCNVIDSYGYVETVTTGTISIFPAMAKRNRKARVKAFLQGSL